MQTPQASEPTHAVCVDRNVPVPMRDGTVLRADVYRPGAEGKYPVLVERVGYELTRRCKANGEFFASRGYVFVGQNVRGAFGSEGQFVPIRDDGWGANRDGYDTVEWAGAQPWSSGNVGLVGGSYSGITQYLALPTRPPHLKASFVREGASDAYRDFVFRNGAYRLQLSRGWAIQNVLAFLQHDTAPETEASRRRLEKAMEEIESWLRHLPLKSCPPLAGLADWHFEALDQPHDGPHWWETSLSLKFGDVDTPIVHLGGWFDIAVDSTLRSFLGIRRAGRSEACRKAQRLVIGPWIHGPQNVGKQAVGELDFGPEAAYDLNAHRLDWYDHWLKGVDSGAMDSAPVRIFLMGENRWLDLEDWPPEGIAYRPVYLREGSGKGETSLNNGGLTFCSPERAERPDSFVYDPEDPVPSLIVYPGGGPADHRPVEARMLTYTTEALDTDLTLIGPVKAVLHGLSSAPDTDWVVRLCDVWPDGRSMSVCDGILRARYRDSLEHTELMIPQQIYRFEVDLWATAQVFKAGHRLRVQVTSSDFPRYDRNLNTGGPFGEEARGIEAVNTVFHDAMRPSHLLLPVISPKE